MADFSFIQDESIRGMMEEAFKIITDLHQWDTIIQFHLRYESFMTTEDRNIINIINNINNGKYGHSGASIGFLMRTMEEIARFGLEQYKHKYLERKTNK